MKRLITLMLALCPLPALAQGDTVSYFKDGNELLASCDSSSAFDQGICSGYIIGAVDGLGPRFAQMPEGITVGQMKDVVVKFLRNNPEDRHMPAGALTLIAVTKAWPKHNSAKK